MAPKRQTTAEERKTVHNETNTVREIAAFVGIPRSTVYKRKVMRTYNKEGFKSKCS